MSYVLHILILGTIYLIAVLGLKVLVTDLGVVSVSQAAFFGIGGYTAALFPQRFSSDLLMVAIVSMVASAALGYIIATTILRLRDDFLVISTLAIQGMFVDIANNSNFSGGPDGISGIATPTVLGFEVDSQIGFLGVAGGLGVLIYFMIWELKASSFELVLHAVRLDERFAQSLGKDISSIRRTVFAFTASLASLAGVLYGYYIKFVDPSSFSLGLSVSLLLMVILGGPGRLWGVVISTFLLVILPEALRLASLPADIAAALRQILYGALLVTLGVFRPRNFRLRA